MIPTLTDLAFSNGDLVEVQVSPGVYDLSTVTDNQAVQQGAGLTLNLQTGFNQYSPTEGWNIFQYLNANISSTDVAEICKEVKRLMERIDFVVEATCTYLGSQQEGPTEETQMFSVKIRTTFGTTELPLALGGAS